MLKQVFYFMESKGFPIHDYEFVTNFPRRIISHLNPKMTLREADLFPQETLFIQ